MSKKTVLPVKSTCPQEVTTKTLPFVFKNANFNGIIAQQFAWQMGVGSLQNIFTPCNAEVLQ